MEKLSEQELKQIDSEMKSFRIKRGDSDWNRYMERENFDSEGLLCPNAELLWLEQRKALKFGANREEIVLVHSDGSIPYMKLRNHFRQYRAWKQRNLGSSLGKRETVSDDIVKDSEGNDININDIF